MDPSAAGSSPVLLYVALVLSILVAVAGAVPKILGPLGKTYDEWQSRRRASAADEEYLHMKTRKEEIAYYKGMTDALLQERRDRDALIEKHLVWDYTAKGIAAENGVLLEPAPPLFPKLRDPYIEEENTS